MLLGARRASALALGLAVLVGGCGNGDEPNEPLPTIASTATDDVDADEAAAIDAFTRHSREAVELGHSGKIPDDAFESTAFGELREDEIRRLRKDAEGGVIRVGEPEYKDITATVDGDTAMVVACLNADEWGFKVGDADPIFPETGWTKLGRELTRVDGTWLLSGYAPEQTGQECE